MEKGKMKMNHQISKIYENIFGRYENIVFDFLPDDEKTMVLDYVLTNNIEMRFFSKRGYDVIKKQFFAFEYKLHKKNNSNININQ